MITYSDANNNDMRNISTTFNLLAQLIQLHTQTW